jgi:hypothetical protein
MNDLKILRDSGLLDHRHEPIRQNRSVDKYHRRPEPADVILDVRPVQLYSFHSWRSSHFPRACATQLKLTAELFLRRPGQVIELRALETDQTTMSGYFNDPVKLVEAAKAASGKGIGVYATLNVVNPDLLSRAVNRLTFTLPIPTA